MSTGHQQHDFGSGCIEKWAGFMKIKSLMNISKIVIADELLCEAA
jgi:hypothetical protein